MYLLLVILVLSTRKVLSDTDVCEEANLTEIDEIRVCDDNVAPLLRCTRRLFEFITVMHNLNQNWTENYSLLSNINQYENLMIAFDVLKDIGERYILFVEFITYHHEDTATTSDTNYCIDLYFLTTTKEYYLQNMTDFDELRYWIDDYLPVIFCVEFTFGMLGNILIVVIFLRHSDMWNGPNKVVFNLAVADILLIINNVALYYIRFRWMPLLMSSTTICILSYGRTVTITSSVYSMVLLSTLRYLATVYPESKYLKDNHGRLLLGVWGVSAVVGIPDIVFADVDVEFYSGIELKYIHLVFLCLLPLSVICILSFSTSRVIRASIRQLPAGVERQRRSRQRGAKVIRYLSLVLCITYLPINLYEVSVTNLSWEYHYTFLVRVLLPINSCLNPVALFVGSQTYRKHLSKLIRCDACKRHNILQLHKKT